MFMPPYIFPVYAVFLCVYTVRMCLDSLAYFLWAWAGRRPAELVLSEDWPHVGLCGRVKIGTHTPTHTQTHWTGGLGCVFFAEWL